MRMNLLNFTALKSIDIGSYRLVRMGEVADIITLLMGWQNA
jgi:hypothetical protein